jgi:hypothetical protein
MIRFLLFLSLACLTACSKDIPGQLKYVQGNVADYLTGEPLSNIPLIIGARESLCFYDCKEYIIDTVYTDSAGNYSSEFYTDSVVSMNYFIFALTPPGYSHSCEQMISGENNFILKSFIKVHISLINKKDEYNAMCLYNYAISTCTSHFIYDSNLPTTEDIYCYNGDCDTIQNVIPGARNSFQIGLSRYTEGKWGETKDTFVYFNAGTTDTAFTFCY